MSLLTKRCGLDIGLSQTLRVVCADGGRVPEQASPRAALAEGGGHDPHLCNPTLERDLVDHSLQGPPLFIYVYICR